MASKSLKIVLLVFVLLLILIGSVQATGGKEGCTPGYWKNHEESWQVFTPDQSFESVFGVTYDGKTLLEALNTGGGGKKALGRHAVAALLNAAHPDVNFAEVYIVPFIVEAVQYAYEYGAIEFWKDKFEYINDQYCPLD